MDKNFLKTDWLASKPVFYNEKTKKISHNINDVIDIENFEFDGEGLNNYLKYGYSVFEQTPIKNVKFLRHSSEISLEGKELKVKHLEDPAERYYGISTTKEQVIGLLENEIQRWESNIEEEIVLPTSGGYDSRILNAMLKDRKKIKSYTYGISTNQKESFEVVYAEKIAEILKTDWKFIPIGDFHSLFEEWDNLYGVSTHAHGMYQMEFYHRIIKDLGSSNYHLLSGVVGGAWAGGVNLPNINQQDDLIRLAHNHRMNADCKQSLLKSKGELEREYFENNKHKLNDRYWKTIESMRMKIILLSYLTVVPQSLGFKVWTPFFNQEVALSMLNLPQEVCKNKQWEKEYFQKFGLDVEKYKLKVNKRNTLNYQAFLQKSLHPLDEKLLSEIINPNYIKWINRNITSFHSSKVLLHKVFGIRKVGGGIRRLGFKDPFHTIYSAYLTLKPLENLLKKRENSFKKSF
ncbi:hypothetical protein [Priestia megaterium]|uniref:hypothetical protein n=1 Tax=Priestia megaterium TaxID=1404 RepID=UPI002E1B39FB|nr:hypothetical protein [Priestia megaterium]